MARIGLYFGSFNPVHYGHLLIAQEALCNEKIPMDKVFFIPSPQNPHKQLSDLADYMDRLGMLFAATKETKGFEVSMIENGLPLPSYTCDTLNAIEKEWGANHEYYIIMGTDNYNNLHTWKNCQEIIDNYKFLIIKRDGQELSYLEDEKFTFLTDVSPLSSTQIRDRVKIDKPIDFFTHPKVVEYIQTKKLYK